MGQARRRKELLFASLVTVLALVVAVPAGGQVTDRLGGASRFETAVEISRAAFPTGADTVYLARAYEPLVDALAAGVLVDGPILLVPPTGSVPQVVLDEIGRVQPSRVVALGGVVAVADDVLNAASRGGHVPDDEDSPLDGTPIGPPGGPVVTDARYPTAPESVETWHVVVCEVDHGDMTIDPDGVADFIEEANDYFAWLSGRQWQVDAVGAGIVDGGEGGSDNCDAAAREEFPAATNVLSISNFSYGSGGMADLGGDSIFLGGGVYGYNLGLVAHELGHTLGWPHPSSPPDIPMAGSYEDLMSYNKTVYWPSTHVFNRYLAGWIDDSQLRVHDKDAATYTIGTVDTDELQMIVVPTAERDVFYAIGARGGVETSDFDRDVPDGVTVMQIDQPRGTQWAVYPSGEDRFIAVGEQLQLGDVELEVTGRAGDGFSVTISGREASILRAYEPSPDGCFDDPAGEATTNEASRIDLRTVCVSSEYGETAPNTWEQVVTATVETTSANDPRAWGPFDQVIVELDPVGSSSSNYSRELRLEAGQDGRLDAHVREDGPAGRVCDLPWSYGGATLTMGPVPAHCVGLHQTHRVTAQTFAGHPGADDVLDGENYVELYPW